MDRSGVAVRGLKEGDREEDWAPLAPHLPAEQTFRRIIQDKKLNFLLHDRIGLREGEKVSESTTTPVT